MLSIVLIMILFEYRYESFGVTDLGVQDSFDVMVILGGPLYPNGTLHRDTLSRVTKAISLYKKGIVEKIVFSGGIDIRFNRSVAEMMAERALALGIGKDEYILEERSVSTVGNAYYIKPILEKNGWTKVLIITSEYHVARANMVFQKVLGEKYEIRWASIRLPRSFYDDLENQLRERTLFLIHDFVLLGVAYGDHEGVKERLKMFNLPLMIKHVINVAKIY